MKKYATLLMISSMLASTLSADTIELKSGKTHKGKIISEDATSYVIEIRYSSSITDERRIPKEQISKITKDGKDEKAFNAIKSFVPTPDALSKNEYAQRISKTSRFVRKFRKSKHRKEAKRILKTLRAEGKIIAHGGIKLNGQMISASDIEANSYDIDASITANKIKYLAQNNNLQKSLREWEKLEINFPYSSAYVDSLPLVIRIVSAYQQELNRDIQTLPTRNKKRNAVLGNLSENDRARTLKIRAVTQARYDQVIEKEKNIKKTKWLTIDTFNADALKYNLESTKKTLSELTSKDISKIKLAGNNFRGAWASIAKGNIEDAQLRLSELESLKIPAKYIDPLKEKLTEKQASEAAANQATDEETQPSKATETPTENPTTEPAEEKPATESVEKDVTAEAVTEESPATESP